MERPDAGRLCCPARHGGVWLLALLTTLPAGLTLAEGTSTSTGGTPAAPSATAKPADNEILLYHVQPGDTLLGLSREKLDTPERWRDVQKLNHIRNPRHLQPGTTLRMLPGWLKPKVAQALLESASNEVKLNGKPAHDGAAIPEGTTVQTGPDSAAVITLPDGTRLRIPSATEVRLERLRAYHGERHLDAGFLLRHGSIEPDSPGKRSRPLNIKTPSGNAAVRGTHFRVHAEGPRSTVEVLRGQVAAGNRKATADVDAGKGAWFTAKSKPVVAQLLPAPDLGGIQGRTWTQTAPRLPLPALTGDAAAYHVEVSTRPDFSAVLLDTRTQEPDFVLPSRQDGPHYVRVSAISRTGIEGYAGTTKVQVSARPLPPRLQPQPDEVQVDDRPVLFRWLDTPDTPATGGTTEASGQTSSAADRTYRIQVAGDADFAQVLHDEVAIHPEDLMRLDTRRPLNRWWRVACVEKGRQGPWSTPQKFRLRVGAPIIEARPLPAVRTGSGEPVRTGYGDFLLLSPR